MHNLLSIITLIVTYRDRTSGATPPPTLSVMLTFVDNLEAAFLSPCNLLASMHP